MILATEDQSKTGYVHRLQQPDQWIEPVALPPLPAITPKSRFAVVTLGTGDRGRELLEISRPSIQAYAAKVGADYHEITGDPTNPAFVFWDKFRSELFFDHYERIVYVDSDIVIRATAPNLFDLIPADQVAVHDETPFMGLAYAWIWQEFEWLCRSQGYGQIIPRGMFNTGFWVASRQHREAFKPMTRPFQLTHCAEQVHISMRLHQLGFPIWPMTRRIHWQHWNDKAMKLFPQGQFLHFSGITDHAKRLALMRIAAGSARIAQAAPKTPPAAVGMSSPTEDQKTPEKATVGEKKPCGCGKKDRQLTGPKTRPLK
ncbi:hypothetical protein PX52LOC_00725 [Limnoglobus roseus]|uniref:Uncharacterized protein n=2 Tax=Limnoglobus roseus TaxID=2598579 RepID=A0A5C1A6L6_9BACT|nr:hypothetical protein PX52LOC_00725 [Limnoglobus roseus]